MPVPPSALADAYTRLTKVFPGLDITQPPAGTPVPQHGGWITAAALAEGDTGLDTFLAWDDAQILRDYGQSARTDVVASFGLHRYAWPACLLITVPWFLLRRVPRFPVTHVSYDRTAPGLPIGRLAARPTTFACLPGDPAATLPGARVVPDEEALRTEVRAAVAEHLEPVLAGFGPRMRRRGRALWGMATDEVVEGLWYVAHLFGDGEQERARRELELLLPGATKPYVGSAAFRELTGPNGESLPTRDRASCCMFYTLRPADTCPTCPRTCDADRVTRLLAAAS
ncbi:iron-sulfur protein [Streptomyces viridochromogenes]|uniref:Iron-sulfur protein n=1 Tax=Streptomyces viridochromogenes TaxID=1938 RepID=A0A0J7YU39_STRVR|nr:(2Fe-2S)-binding protein [Streptomyces viridochromogenes]KMS66678.1 iron-sulfur protein [Streptomyces viridochromogenes]KOG25143.1 iron-sulfur protein [Streptomyces viridochromogenes]KOG25876.1 iron-sulfur protein [Streptomyces viridochromogenes]